MFITYLLIRLIFFPLAYLPYRAIHAIGRPLGTLAYYLVPKYRKRALSNLALAIDAPNEEIRTIAKKSLQSLMITCLEYPRLARETDISRIATTVNPETANSLMEKGKGIIFFCGHQANWELLFLEGTSRMPGVAIGRPIKNRYLYSWVQKMRQKFGGKIVEPKNAIKEGLRALKKGSFMGIVGDQGMPDSGFSSPFFGRPAYTSPMPALLACKTLAPIIVATTHRENGHYYIHYSDPLFPNPEAPLDTEVRRLMEAALNLYEESIRNCPDQWMWIHNRWKQQTTDQIKRPFRQDSIAVFLPDQKTLFENLSKLRTLYPTEHLAIFAPEGAHIHIDAEVHTYQNLSETLLDDLRFKLIVNFTNDPTIDRHYRKTAQTLLSVTTLEELEKEVLRA